MNGVDTVSNTSKAVDSPLKNGSGIAGAIALGIADGAASTLAPKTTHMIKSIARYASPKKKEKHEDEKRKVSRDFFGIE